MSAGNLSRRDFLAGVLAAGMGLSAGTAAERGQKLLLAAATGTDPACCLRQAIEALGGIRRFVRPGDKVMLLPNPQGRARGTSTRPELVEELVRLCLGAGASKVEVCSIHSNFRWSGTGIDKAAIGAGASIWIPGGSHDWTTVKVKGGRRHKSLRVITPVLKYDVVINMPIGKQHGSTRFTGALKNLMGVNYGNTSWHQGTAYLVDSIVDLASVIRPSLHVVDSTVVLAENGPFGPGRTISPNTVIAGVDPVAVDTYGASLLGMDPAGVSTITQAAERGLGTLDLVEDRNDNGVKTFYGG